MAGIRTATVGSVPFAVTNSQRAVATLIDLAHQDTGEAIRLANAFCIAQASRDPDYRALLTNSGINLPDGTPVAWLMRRRLGDRSIRAVRGPGLLPATVDAGRPHELRHFFLGTTCSTLKKLTDTVESRYPGAQIVGTYAPPFVPFSESLVAECAERIRAASPDIVWVGLGSPKQDFVADALAKRTDCVCVGVGAAFDFLAGTVREAPAWLHNSGFEWAFRFAMEPRRLWRRYLIGNTLFLRAVLFPRQITSE